MSTTTHPALQYIAMGWPVVPLYEARGSGCSCPNKSCRSPGKHPRTTNGVKEASLNATLVAAWIRQWPACNWGVATGCELPDGGYLAVVDVDPRNGGSVDVAAMPDTVRAATGGGGWHYLFRTEAPIGGGVPDVGIDLKGAGGYIVVAPSNHASGGHYAWDAGGMPGESPIAPLPAVYRVPERPQATDYTSSGDDPANTLLGFAFAAMGWLGNRLPSGKRGVRCPWRREHSDSAAPWSPNDSDSVLMPPKSGSNYGWFHCSHGHCANRTAREVHNAFPGEVMTAASEKYPRLVLPEPEPTNTQPLATIGASLTGTIARIERRRSGDEKPVPLPWPDMATQFGGGLWPGVHVLVGGTGVGKTALALQIARHAAEAGVPVGYVGLELEEMQIGVRLLSDFAGVRWSDVYLGKADGDAMAKVREAQAKVEALPFYAEFSKPGGWPVSLLSRFAEGIRKNHPDDNGTKPMLLVLDFLQIVGDEESTRTELRERIGKAAYSARGIAPSMNAAILLISSVSRDKYGLLAGDISDAGLGAETTQQRNGPPLVRRYIKAPDVLVGLGKESGEIEFSADSVTAAIKWPEPDLTTRERRVILATAKGRATGEGWCELLFNGHRFQASKDGGGALATLVAAIKPKEAKGPRGRGRGGKDDDAG